MKRFLLLVAFGLGLDAPASAAQSFRLYAPSPTAKQLWVIHAVTSPSGLDLSVEKKVDLGFAGSSIEAHPTAPLLYVGGGGGKDVPAAVLSLDANGGCSGIRSFQLKHGTAYLSTDRAGRFLLSADYRSGAVDVYGLDASGFPAKHVAGRDEGRSEAHCVLPSPDNRFVYIPYVKQNNALLQYAFDGSTGALTPLTPADAGPPEGTGPRHIAYHPKLPVVYFSNEQHLGVSVYDRDVEGRLKFRNLCEAVNPSESREGISSSDIVMTVDGRYVFAGIRGHTRDFDWIARYRADALGDLTLLGLTPADKIPWGFALSPDDAYLAVTAFEGASISVYRVTSEGDLVKAASLPCDKNISDIIAR